MFAFLLNFREICGIISIMKNTSARPYHHGEHIVYSCQYHVIFCPKYRRKVLVDGIDTRLKEILTNPTYTVIAVIGNLVPIPFLVVFTRKVFEWLRTKSEWLDSIVKKLEAKAENKKDIVLKYEFWGLVLLVAIPLPGTGAWTGALVAAMMDMRLKRAMPAIILGVLIAGVSVKAYYIACTLMQLLLDLAAFLLTAKLYILEGK